MRYTYLLLVMLAFPLLQAQTVGQPDPEIQKIVGEISRDRIAATMQKLALFETRGNFSDPNQKDRGIGAARRWILDQFKSYSPRLDVSFDPYKVKKQGTRILRDVEVVNVVAVLPGTTQPEKRVVVGAHYDSLNIVRKANAPEVTPEGGEPAADDVIDFEKSVEAPAPGVTDNAAGTALVLELARVMSRHKFEKTIVFIAFGGEEIGLVGSSLYAARAKEQKARIEAVLNNDVVGVSVAGDGHAENGLVHVFSEDPADSPSRELARYVRETAQRYVPSFKAEPIFRQDRFARGGDHSPFNANGFAAIRFTSAAENLGIQHTASDTYDKSSPDYATQVARVNGATLASLALAPSVPETTREVTTGAAKGRKTPTVTRGKSHYDAVLRWKDATGEDLAGYAIVIRSSTAPFWEQQTFVGKVTEYTLRGVGIDDIVFGVKAIDKEGHESVVAPWVAAPYALRKIETQ
ncbi:MAG TPA: M20/M25/M40 family metallo-hydrolase [Bryobacteraceae bacterium]|nr:M20/M25/M40 family metallo-hydrolase [Bryobacteraceae bacterium]